jgi:hypothetical protein
MLKRCSFLLILTVLLACPRIAEAEMHTFFPGTQYAVDVYFLRGEKPGPTIMVQGGIQGDEYCGYLTAQLLAQAKVTKGTLIVVPRANPPSIHARARQINVDLNRRFDKDYCEFYEDNLARLIRFLVGQSQGLIHLHAGSGFYNPVKLDDLHGPKRYGQSVIIDTTVYKNLHLERMAGKVLAQLNDGLNPDKYKFKLFDMETFSDRSPYQEHRKDLTYYTLTHVGVPAVAIEVSKNLTGRYWDYWKVSHQLQAALLFLKQLGVEAEAPPVKLEDFQTYPPRNLRVAINGQTLDPDKPTLRVTPGVPLDVRCETTGPQNPLAPIPGVFASDRPDRNLLKVHRLPLAPFETLDIRSDGLLLAKAQLTWNKSLPASQAAHDGDLVCWLNGKLTIVPPGQTVTAVQGDQLILEGIEGGARQEVLSLKGYMPHLGQKKVSDAGQEIVLDPGNFVPKFLLQAGTPGEYLCSVARETPGLPPSRFSIRLVPRVITTLVLTADDGKTIRLPWSPDKPAQLPAGRYTLTDIQGNGPASMVQPFLGNVPLELGRSFRIGGEAEIVLRQVTTFADLGKMPVSGEHGSTPGPLATN